jgi:hypothetical protein
LQQQYLVLLLAVALAEQPLLLAVPMRRPWG